MVALITDLPSLCAAIALWATRTGDVDFEAACPVFVQLGTVRLNHDLRTADMERFSQGITNTDGCSTLPDDFLGVRAVFTDTPGHDALEYVTPEHYAASYPHSGVPHGYTIIGNELRTWPVASGSMTMVYYSRIPDLSADNPTNWLVAKYPNLYLYACLLEAAPFMEEDQRAQVWLQYYQTALGGANRGDTRVRYPGGVMLLTQDTP